MGVRGIARKVVLASFYQLTHLLIGQFGNFDATLVVDPGPLDNLAVFLITTFTYQVSNVAPENLYFHLQKTMRKKKFASGWCVNLQKPATGYPV